MNFKVIKYNFVKESKFDILYKVSLIDKRDFLIHFFSYYFSYYYVMTLGQNLRRGCPGTSRAIGDLLSDPSILEGEE